MKTKKTIIATIIGAIILFLFDGTFQLVPNFGIKAVERVESNDFTTPKFSELSNRMAYIATDKTVSFVASKESGYYNVSRFLALEFVSAFCIALIFALLFANFDEIKLRERLWLTFGFSLIASCAIHLPYFNWWGFSVPYTVGVISKTILGWFLIVYIQNKFIFKIK